jgi:PhnB protein
MAIVRGIPEGFHTLTPALLCRETQKAIEFYKRAFGATEVSRFVGPDGKIMNAQLRIGDSIFMLSEENLVWDAKSPQSLNGSPVSVQIYVEDCDKAFNTAVAAGATVSMPVEDMFWGDRWGSITDPFGHHWSIATRQKEMNDEEIKQAAGEFFSRMQNANA